MHAAGLTRAVGGGAVLGGVVDELELRQLDGLHHERRVLLGVPLEYQVIRGVGHCSTEHSHNIPASNVNLQ